MAKLPDKGESCVTCLQTRVLALDPVTKKACFQDSDFDRSSRDKVLAIADHCFDQSRIEFCRPRREVCFPVHPEVPRA
ncbi:uncharacterized protein STEHIDRAFT_123507 [Stereum hirsutum FP-91666 SS1]|uniref:uncharacterized protein n=1 Tax=Stereum hirsutum (strain FP-91666) TaxID=721885 RepID=UPI000444A1F0|nr:uncharacterized protein STEHIDRAFT_123507 [Stereum hirsutum FP-91666 SS1]EIM83951.1 hypothetical protein STEHIDRAFT_123507 [Stereum hirsutum FP-91666 SS1]